MYQSPDISSSLPTLRTIQIGLGNVAQRTGGAERIFSELSANLPRYGVQFFGAVAESSPGDHAGPGIRYAFASPGCGLRTRLIGARRVLVRAFREEKFDLVASHFALYGFPLLDQIGKTPFVVHFHGPWYAESLQEGEGRVAAFAKRQIEKLVYGRADTIIVLSRAFADFIHRSFAIPREKIQVIPGCVDLDRFAVELPRSDARMRLGWPLNARIMVAVRRLSHRMGLDVLIDAMPRILRSNPEALLVIAGKGQILTALQAKVAQLGLEQRVNFLGFVPDEQLPLVYRAADLNIVPTRAWEGFGLVAAEGLASGTPSMVTPVGGLPEVVAPLSPDLVFKDQSSVSIAAGINRVFAGEISLPSAVECTEYAKKHFASSQMAERTAEVYFDVVRSRRRRMFVRP